MPAAADTASTTAAVTAAPELGPNSPPSAQPAAGPEKAAAAAATDRPSSGKNPSAGPQFKKVGDTWRVIAPEVVLSNTVTDPAGKKCTVTFEVFTAKADGTKDTKVILTDANKYGVLVSDFVASGATASKQVDYGRLKPGVTYLVHTSAYNGSLYENDWSPWAKFRIEPYATFPAPQATSGIDQLAQKNNEFTRTDPVPANPAASPKNGTASSGTDALPTLRDMNKTNCSPAGNGHRICFVTTGPRKPGSTAKNVAPRSASGASAKVDRIPWCANSPDGKDVMNRTEACLRNVGGASLFFFDSDPDKPAFGKAHFEFEQRLKTYRNKTESGSDFAEFDQQLVATPTSIDPALQGITLAWNLDSSCAHCDTQGVTWTDAAGNNLGGGAYWAPNAANSYPSLWGTNVTKWTGSGKERINLGWSVTASVDASSTGPVTVGLGTSGTQDVRELAPRCDDITPGAPTPGCVLPYFVPTFTVDTNLYPAAGAYYWYMQESMKVHAGSKKFDSLLHYLGPDTTVKNSSGNPWTRSDSGRIICPDTWPKHPVDAAIGSTDCDEYAMASTHESGGFPGSVNHVSSGDQCAQLLQDKSLTDFGLFADIRTAKNGPTGDTLCSRATINSAQNQGAFSKLQPSAWRLLDNDGFFVDLPGYAQCVGSGTDKTCAWRKA
ncbi:hypothetical protein ACFV98_20990 [Streptomyces violascens]|uniref:hypothetical protein n=1 Tax=Streptomyces violascens TaxID=67381 RepID=UPI00365ABE32